MGLIYYSIPNTGDSTADNELYCGFVAAYT